jgi:hypothetical protein
MKALSASRIWGEKKRRSGEREKRGNGKLKADSAKGKKAKKQRKLTNGICPSV